MLNSSTSLSRRGPYGVRAFFPFARRTVSLDLLWSVTPGLSLSVAAVVGISLLPWLRPFAGTAALLVAAGLMSYLLVAAGARLRARRLLAGACWR